MIGGHCGHLWYLFFITSSHQVQTICPLFSGGHLVLINYHCVCVSDQGGTLYLTMCVLTQKWVNLRVSICLSDLGRGY